MKIRIIIFWLVIAGNLNAQFASDIGSYAQKTDKEEYRILTQDSFAKYQWTGLQEIVSNTTTQELFQLDVIPSIFKQDFKATVNDLLWQNAFWGSATQLSVDFGDIDNDGDIDIVQGSRYRLEILLNEGTNSFILEDYGGIIDGSNEFWKPCLVDIDNDGDLDLFTGKLNGSIAFWENTGTSIQPIYNLGVETAIVNGNPDFCDIDGDGDYDLFVGDGNTIYFYENTGNVENFVFQLSNATFLPTLIGITISSLEFSDIDGDNDADLFISSENGTITFLINSGNINNPYFEEVTTHYNDIYLGWSDLDADFHDIDNDGDLDLFLTDLKGYFYLYRNDGNSNTANWILETSMFTRVLNFGRSSAPATGDIDGDGDIDMIFGTGTILRNAGSKTEPLWQLNTNLSNNPDYTFNIPELADIDNDGDLDLFYANNSGYISFYENTGNSNNPIWQYTTQKLNGLDFGSNSHPSVNLIDIDDDGDLDMFIQYCNWDNSALPVAVDILQFYENAGTPETPEWQLLNEDFFPIRDIGIIFGRCCFKDVDYDGDFDYLSGSGDGQIHLFENTGDKSNMQLNYRGVCASVEEGTRYSTPYLEDFNNDGLPELIAGLDGGGLNFWWNMSDLPTESCEVQDSLALVAIYNQMGGPNWDMNFNWLSKNVSTWYGVNVAGGKVRRLELDRNGLKGELIEEVGLLDSLQVLNLVGNEIEGKLPASLYNLEKLEQCLISDNRISGGVEADLTGMKNLKEFIIDGNQIDSLPDLIINSQCNTFGISQNSLTFEDLEHNIDLLVNNFIYSPQKKIGTLDTLIIQSGSNYTFNISCGGSQNQYQWLKDNQPLNAPVTEANFTIENFSYENNGFYSLNITNELVPDLTIQTHPVLLTVPEPPCDILDSLALVQLYIQCNGLNWQTKTNWLTNVPVRSWYGVTVENGKVTEIILNSNNLLGMLPDEMSNLTELRTLHLYNNNLSGTLEPITTLLNLTYVVCDENQFSGDLNTMSNKLNMYWLSFENNELSGTIEPLMGLTKLEGLYLNGNQLTGNIPSGLGMLTNLRRLSLYQNQLTGSIPNTIGQLINLDQLWLNQNQLSGIIPPEIGNLNSLTHLGLYINQLSGELPPEIGNMHLLKYLGLFQNNLSGKLPNDLGRLNNLEVLTIRDNDFSGNIPDSLGILPFLYALRIENNKFVHTHIEPIFDWTNYQNIQTNFIYSPQDSIGTEYDINLYEGEDAVLFVPGYTPSQYDIFQWFKDGNIVPSQSSDTLLIENVSLNDAGIYQCKVTNSVVSGLTLISRNINFNISSDICVTPQFNKGWGIFSVNNFSEPGDIKSMFQPLIDNGALIKIQDEQGNSLENLGIFGGWANNIGDVSPTEGYKIKMNFDDSLTICGMPVAYPFPTPLTAGWNIAGYPQQTEVDGMSIVQQLITRGSLIKVQDEAGNSIENLGIFGGWQNNIGNFIPGEGYKFKVASDDTLWINESYTKSTIMLPEPVATTHFIPVYEGNGVDHMNINLVELPGNLIQPGDEFAVFDGNLCVGAVTVLPYHLSKGTVSIAASAMDSYGMPGFAEGNEFTLKVWNAGQNMEYILIPDIISGTTWFDKNESTLASLEKYIVTGFNELFEEGDYNVKCYPNPFNEEITIEFVLSNDSKVNAEVINQLGQRIKYLSNNRQLTKGVHRLRWDGTNAGNGQVVPGIYYLKLEINDVHVYRKIVLSK